METNETTALEQSSETIENAAQVTETPAEEQQVQTSEEVISEQTAEQQPVEQPEEPAEQQPAEQAEEVVEQQPAEEPEESAEQQPAEEPEEVAEQQPAEDLAEQPEEEKESAEQLAARETPKDKAEVLARVKEIVANEEMASKQELDLLKLLFYKYHNAEIQEAHQAFLDAGGNPEKFVPQLDPLEPEFRAFMQIIRERRAAAQEEQERQKQENLERKLKILERIQQLAATPEEANKAFDEFKTLQNEWKEIKAVPAERATELWKNYQLYVEQFYDLLKLGHELRDYDFKKNLEIKNRLCEQAEALANVEDVISANNQLQSLHQEWKETGPVAKDLREDLWNRFKEASTVVRKRHQEHFEALKAVEEENLAQKTAICEEIEALKTEVGDNDPDTFEQQLQKAKAGAEELVKEKSNQIAQLEKEKERLQGQVGATEKIKKVEKVKLAKTEPDFKTWLDDYNAEADHQQELTIDDIIHLSESTADWEAIRQKQGQLTAEVTKAQTTCSNEKANHDKHQEKKPADDKAVLENRKVELEQKSNTELVDCQARKKRHDDANAKMGALSAEIQTKRQQRDEWEEIANAIGGDGKTLRKIAQCYTLRFLIAHANVEIRKFNSRYELQQVRNSLGIRVIDHDRADDVRDTTSLSGGETFIVSLGLALGLSALSSRNISFENLFIDEGFGTLDHDTLETVINSLAMLQSSQGKKVGVISHTDTMSRITTQIRVIRNGSSGSSHIEIYP